MQRHSVKLGAADDRILAANLFLKTSWRRIVLVACIIPLAILRNGFRILVIGLLCVNAGPQMITVQYTPVAGLSFSCFR